MYTVAVSYLEWIRWVATGWFRCADRVVWVEGVDDQSGVDALLDRTPDLQVADDQGYVIARLRSDFLTSSRISVGERSVGHLWLSVAAVTSFHPLSIRGARLLEADAERAAVRLSEPIFENSWTDWRDRRLEDEAHWRGFSLCAAFGLDLPVLKNIAPQLGDILAGRKTAPNASRVRAEAIEGTRALGWASAMSVAVMESDVRAAFIKTPEFLQINSLIKARKSDFDLRRPLLDDELSVKSVRATDGVLRKLGAEVLPLELMATVLHYRSVAEGGRQVSLDAIVDDLATIALEDPNNASLAAYFIGRSMENVAVTTLLYQSEPSRYSALAPSLEHKQLSVMSLAAKRLEARQSVNEGHKANQGGEADLNAVKQNYDATSDSADGARAEQPVAQQQIFRDGSISSSEDSSVVTLTPFVPMEESHGAALTTDSIVGAADLARGVSPTPSDEVGEKNLQAENSGIETMTELFPQTIDGPELSVAAAKGKKPRKKSGKTLEIMISVDTTNDTSDK